ncbi:serine/arginine repetitive matrix protein 1-like [Schistocerca serialis cubense]|uniref:serine/arginine repetitive matrix protein 1-like n=1 Tax=Schistocerca serialis cubense TaxID=2023355 RepID=UPI00214E1A76|nr:serine/arginine repetitive matrix protein 1-like [Schistocerca serialis cubense]
MEGSRDGTSPIRAVSAVREEAGSREGSPLRRQGAIKRHDSPHLTGNARRKRRRVGRRESDSGSPSDSGDAGTSDGRGRGDSSESPPGEAVDLQESQEPTGQLRTAAPSRAALRPSELGLRRASSLTTLDSPRCAEASAERSPSAEPAAAAGDEFLRNFRESRRQSAAGISPEVAERDRRESQLSSNYGNAWDLRGVGKESEAEENAGDAPEALTVTPPSPRERVEAEDSTYEHAFFFPGDVWSASEMEERTRAEMYAPETPPDAAEEARPGLSPRADDSSEKNGSGFLSVLRAYRRSLSREASPLEAIAGRVLHRRGRSASGDARGAGEQARQHRDSRSLLDVVRHIAKSRTPPPAPALLDSAGGGAEARRRSRSPFLAFLGGGAGRDSPRGPAPPPPPPPPPPRRSRSTCDAPSVAAAPRAPRRSSSARPVPAQVAAAAQLTAAVRRRRRRLASSSDSSTSSSSGSVTSSSAPAAPSSSSDGGATWRRRGTTGRSYSDASGSRGELRLYPT